MTRRSPEHGARRQWLQQSVAVAAAMVAPAWLARSASAASTAAAASPAAPLPAARRMVSLGGAVTEVVYALQAQDALVGTDTTSMYPDAATRTPKVGYLRQLSAEGVLSLQPDAVIGAGEAGPAVVLQQLRTAGVRVALVPTTRDWAEVLAKVQMVGEVTGKVAQARALAQQLQTQWDAAQAEVARTRQRPKALFILSHNGSPMVAGKGTAADALLAMAGAQNAVTAFEGYRPLTAEAMAAAAPEVLVNSTQGIDALGGEQAFWQRPELALTPAFAKRALVAMEASHLLGFGPRLPSAVRSLHQQMLQRLA